MITITTTVTDMGGTHIVDIGQAADMAAARQIVDDYFHYTTYEGVDSIDLEMMSNVRYTDKPREGHLATENGHSVASKQTVATASWDTDSGLGIGGINNDQSMPIIPSAQAISRMQQMHDTDTVCRRCGASKNFGGAMFTTVGGNICDDCA